jgi:YedE family putative selenium metabolism protein
MRLKIAASDAAWLVAAGAVAGCGAALLTHWGNPVDGGVSIACFCRDIAGALGLHQIIEFSYLRPEITAIVFGAFASALAQGRFRPTGGSAAIMRFCVGIICSFGVFAFIGCPMRVGLRLAGGDPASIMGLVGLAAGTGMGTLFLRRGFSLGKSAPVAGSNGLLFHAIMAILFILLLVNPAFITQSNERHAPLAAALLAGGAIGVLGQQSKLCFIGGFRNLFLIGDFTLLFGFAATVVSAMIANIFLGQFHWGVHIVGSSDGVWSFVALAVVGIASVFLGGCPFRQLICAAQGDTDAAMSVLGIVIGAAIAYDCGLSFTAGTLDLAGKVAVLGGGAILILIGFLNVRRS